MKADKKQEIIKNIVSKSEIKTEENKLSLIYKLLRRNHELTQVCLEVYKGLRKTDKMSLIEFAWESELARVLFEEEIVLHCTRDLPKGFREEE